MASKAWTSPRQRAAAAVHRLMAPAAAAAAALLLSACAGRSLEGFVIPDERIILVAPDANEYAHEEEQLSRLSLQLDAHGEDASARADLFYRLGLIYDSLGMQLTARAMFMNAMVHDVSYAKPYNFVAIYFFQEGNFQDAIEALDAALELDPGDRYINFSRALILYYARRPATALPDISLFYEDDPDDPYRMLWYYLIDREVSGAEQARQDLRRRRDQASPGEDSAFGMMLLSLYLGELSESGLFEPLRSEDLDARTRNEILCEAYFYLGKLRQEQGDLRQAYDYFRLCQATRIYPFLEYRYAPQELRFIESAYLGRAPTLPAVPATLEEE